MDVTVVATGVGVVLVLAALRDVFHTLLHPSGRGRISVVVTSVVWWSCHRLGSSWGNPTWIAATWTISRRLTR